MSERRRTKAGPRTRRPLTGPRSIAGGTIHLGNEVGTFEKNLELSGRAAFSVSHSGLVGELIPSAMGAREHQWA